MMYNTIHIEASGLGPGSYPIEVGVALANGKRHCTLICPPEDWLHWTRANGEPSLARDNLLVNGRAVLNAALLLNEWLGDSVVYSAAWGNDVCWLATLYARASVRQRFSVESVDNLFPATQVTNPITSTLAASQPAALLRPSQGQSHIKQAKRWRASSQAVLLQQAAAELSKNQSELQATLSGC
ncbi:MAG: hypothetical protein KJP25_10790 [Gammaproteobacteria bacterium]|nr:hypothetical protein [Gammaproteobacteria bacterium]MBT8150744.1 hypothetical protein [Gammaproteobacteria bacterium]NNL11710.1 hypothetical protein [Pseudomonadales bacterium]NNM11358.1 hypothetical protein [Pseudomonadales bacterium]